MGDVPRSMPTDHRQSGPREQRDVHQLQHQLALTEKKQQGMKEKVVALRQEFTQLVQTMAVGGIADATKQLYSGPELPWMATGDCSDTGQSPPRRLAGDRSPSPSHVPPPLRVDAPGSQRACKVNAFGDRSTSPQQRTLQPIAMGDASNG